jgi:hypothetical protein
MAAALVVFAFFTFVRHRQLGSLESEVEPGIGVVGSQIFAQGREEAYRVMAFNTLDGTPIAQASVQLLCARDFANEDGER